MQSRVVQCTRRARYRSERVSASLCPQPVPSSRQACHLQSCLPTWSAGPWAEVTWAGLMWGGGTGLPMERSPAGPVAWDPQQGLLHPLLEPVLTVPLQCSRTCGKGWRKRSVTCRSTGPSVRAQLLPDTLCSAEPRPRTHEACLVKRCHKHRKLQWLVSTWSQVGTPVSGSVPVPGSAPVPGKFSCLW